MKLEAKLRLRAFETNQIRVNEFNHNDHYTKPNARKVASVGNYGIYQAGNLYETIYTVRAGQQTIAYLALDNVLRSKPNNISYSVVAPAFVGKGVGFLLHEWLLAKYKVLTSDDSLSVGASKLWARLIRKHKGHIIIPAFEQYPTHTVAIQGWVADSKGYEWPTVLHNGEVVPVNTLKKTATQKKALQYFFYEVRQ